MTRKDYRAIAEVLKRQRLFEVYKDGTNVRRDVEGVAIELANVFEKDNKNFKKDVFLKACGMEI